MLTPEYLFHVTEGAEKITSDMHKNIMDMIVERIMVRIGRGEDYMLTATDRWQIQVLQAQQSQCCCNTQKEILQSRYDAALQAQNMQAQMAQCLKRFFKAIRNLFTKKVNTVGTYA